MKLVIVESPAKSKTIGQYLGNEYQVEASVGHIRDLAISGVGGFGVDIENDFKPSYVIDSDKKDVVKKLLALKKDSDEVILATDPDREGEAIAWHLANVLDLDIENTKRLEFHEITKASVKNALENPRTINLDLVHSQETRRIIDRIIGFKLSSLLRSKIRSQSAGRVQSVTLKIICEHEKEIQEFIPEEYWNLDASIIKDGKNFKLNLTKIDDKTAKISNETEANVSLDYTKEDVKVSSIDVSKKSISSKEPFRTSTLQQECSSRFKFKTREITSIAQQLYEGVEIDGELVGLITYIRTDSTKLSDVFINNAKSFIISKYGEEYYKGTKSGKNVKLAQDAHEAIRPTNLEITPDIAKKHLSLHQYKVYKLIYERTLASLMQDKIEEVTTVEFKNSHLTFNMKGIKVLFNGFDIFKLEENETNKIPDFALEETFALVDTGVTQNFTKPPLRYSEGKVVKLMEDKGIGRPSTYSSTIQTLLARKYVTLTGGTLKPTEQGILTSNVLTKYFPDLMNTEYTAEMETSLDKISEGEAKEVEIIKDFYFPFVELFDEVKNQMYKEPLKKTGEQCPICGGDLVIRNGKHGEFVGCSNFPKCTYIKKDEKEGPKEVGRNCPTCGSPLVYRKNRRGQEFIGCSNFPKCRYIEGTNPIIIEPEEERICPECGAKLVVKTSRRGPFYGCSNYPKCKHVEPLKKKMKRINIIGAGLAGSEAANFLAYKGYEVHLYEKRPLVKSPAHHTDLFGELVCSNSLKNKKLDNACGLLKEEIKHLGSLMMEASEVSKVPSGDSLSVDRNVFATYITNKIKSYKNIIIHNEEVTDFLDGINIICTGPLTDHTLLKKINEVSNTKSYGFFDASAPIIEKDSIDMSKVFLKSRYDQGDDTYINCPMTKEQYNAFYNELINAKRAPLHDFDTEYFEGCLPLEIIAGRGIDTLRFGPLKPVGLEHNGEEFHAVVQLRQDDLVGNLYNLVGFQTNLTYGEQKRVFSMIPGLENAKFIRYGLMHRNSYIYAPKVLDDFLRLKNNKNVFIAGQLSGVEGYVESAATGLLVAYYVHFMLQGKNIKQLSFYSVLGSLIRYITHTGINNFQPMNANFGIVYKANKDPKEMVIERALKAIDDFKNQ